MDLQRGKRRQERHIFRITSQQMIQAPSGAAYLAPDGAGDLLGFGSYKDSAPTELFQREDPEGNGGVASLLRTAFETVGQRAGHGKIHLRRRSSISNCRLPKENVWNHFVMRSRSSRSNESRCGQKNTKDFLKVKKS